MPVLLLAVVLSADPATLAGWLRTGDARAGKAVGVTKADDVRLVFAQLDEDPSEEAILQFEGGQRVEAVVLDSTGAGWRIAGRFTDWWNYKPEYKTGFVEARAVSRAGTRDVVVRTHGGGTEEDSTDLEIFQLRGGALVSILKVNEYSSKMEHPTGRVVSIRTTVAYPAPGVVRATGGETCREYRWTDAGFETAPCR